MGDAVYFVNDGRFVVTCPQCHFSKQVLASSFLTHPKHVKLRLKCRCGWFHSAFLERRIHQRKFMRLEGRCVYLTDKFIHTEGAILIKDMSSQGIGFTLLDVPRVVPLPGDPLSIQFRINDLPEASFKKEVLIKSFKESRVGTRLFKKINFETDKALKIFLAS